MDTVGKRLEHAFSQAGLDRYSFADQVGVNYDTIGRWIRGNKIPAKGLKRRQIESVTGCSANWIETGEGEMRVQVAGQDISNPAASKNTVPEFDLDMIQPGEEMVRTFGIAGDDGSLDHYVRVTFKWMSIDEVEGEK